MGIVQLPTPLAAQGGLLPATKKFATTDNLATITAAGYLNAASMEAFPLQQSDHLEVLYNYNINTHVGTWAAFDVSISNTGVITLVETVAPGGVTVVGTPTTGHIAQFASATSIQDGGVLGTAAAKAASDNTKANVASVFGATVAGNVLEAADTAGTVEDSGVALSNVQQKTSIKAGQAAVGGSGVTYNITVAGCTTASVAVADVNVSEAGAGTGASVIQVLTGAGFIEVTLSADPLAGSSISYIVFLAAQ